MMHIHQHAFEKAGAKRHFQHLRSNRGGDCNCAATLQSGEKMILNPVTVYRHEGDL